jgi:hypothetical protein
MPEGVSSFRKGACRGAQAENRQKKSLKNTLEIFYKELKINLLKKYTSKMIKNRAGD